MMRAGMLAAALIISAQTICWAETASLLLLPVAPKKAGFSIEGLKRIDDFSDREIKQNRVLRADLRYDLASVPNLPQRGIHLIKFDVPTLAPMTFTRFCLKYANECKPQRLVFRGGRLRLTNQRWAELKNVNRTVNSSILPKQNKESLADEKWLLGPVLGKCNDYAVTKRHQLTARGWPARAVLLSEVVTIRGEHHLVAVVRTSGGDLVLDNLTDDIMPWFQKPYQWLRIQTPQNPNYWASISEKNASRVIARRQVLQRFTARSDPA